MYRALDMGVSYTEFWEMSPRAIVTLHREMMRSARSSRRAQGSAGAGVRLNYIPRP